MSQKVERGDFQTPHDWAQKLTDLLPRLISMKPTLIIEPTCGLGAFVEAAAKTFPQAEIYGFDLNEEYVAETSAASAKNPRIHVRSENFFDGSYANPLGEVAGPVLFLGNPPWVTNSVLGVLDSKNLPTKTNETKLKGLDALTGKSNFDISEWMICQMVERLQIRRGMVAMICKSAVARKTLSYAAAKNLKFGSAKFIPLDAKKIFNVSVDCGFFVFDTESISYEIETLDLDLKLIGKLGSRDGRLISNLFEYDATRFLDGVNSEKWRSGLKHDCSSVMEFSLVDGALVNGAGEKVDLEPTYLYPLLKSSDVANGRTSRADRFVLVTQQVIGESTNEIETIAPKTWKYLQLNQAQLNGRKSSIYRGKPAFSIFGVGPYTFAPWKVAISGLYKKLNFVKLGPRGEKPIVLDDTCYFLPCDSEEQADEVLERLATKDAQAFLNSIIFWDAKRPINADVLQRLNLSQISLSQASL